LWMIIIFLFSHQPASQSSKLSGSISKWVFDLILSTPISNFVNDVMLHTLVRKGAHLTVYFILGILVYRAMCSNQVSKKRVLATALLLCVVYAISDEFHQTFIIGRSGQITDVFIDSIGASIGLLITHVYYNRRL